jgi:hypothetical protein
VAATEALEEEALPIPAAATGDCDLIRTNIFASFIGFANATSTSNGRFVLDFAFAQQFLSTQFSSSPEPLLFAGSFAVGINLPFL